MSTKYLLTCTCGQQSKVDSRQAGLTIPCRCGARLEVPTLRGLAELPRLDDQARTAPPDTATWGPRQATMLAGFLLTTIAVIGGIYLYATQPEAPIEPEFAINRQLLEAQKEAMTLSQSFALWTQLSQGLEESRHAAITAYEAAKERYDEALHARRNWALADAVLGIIGIALIIGGVVSGRKRSAVSGGHAQRVPV